MLNFKGKNNRIIIISLVLLSIILLSVIFVEGAGSGSTNKVNLTVLSHPVLYTSGMGGDEGLIPEFMEETDYKVEVITAPLEEILQKTVVDFVSESGSYDIITYNDRSMHSGLADYLLPLDKYVSEAGDDYKFDDILESTLACNRFDDHLYGISFRYGCFMLYYRKDIFEKYDVSVPQDYEDLMDACEKITKGLRSDGINDVYAIVYGGEPGHAIFEDFSTWLFGHGASIADANGNCLLNSESAIQTLEDFITPYKNGWSSPDTPGMTRDKLTTAMQKGKAAMALIYGGYWGLITDPEKSDVYDKFSWSLIPSSPGVKRGRTNFGGWQFIINKDTKNPDAAWELVKYLTTPNAAKYVALEHANAPVRKSVYNDPKYLERYPLAKDWLKAFEASGLAIPGGHEKIAEIMDIIGYEVADALVGKKSPREAMLNAYEKVDKILKH